MIFGPFERMVAARYLRSRRQEGFVSVIVGFSFLGIALGVATLIIVMAVMNGFRQDITSRMLGVSGHIDISATASITNFDELDAHLRNIPGVTIVTPVVEGQVMVSSDRNAAGAIVRGARGEDLAARPWIADHIRDGSLAAFERGEGVLIGSRMAEQHGVKAGDQITLITPKGSATDFGVRPNLRSFMVAGVFEMGHIEYDSGVIFMPLAMAQTYFKLTDAVSRIEVHLADADRAPEIARAIMDSDFQVRALPWQILHGEIFAILQVQRNVIFLIVTLIIIVAAFNTISGLIMLVTDKARDIAILRTMGATRGMVMRVFLLAGSTVGAAGTLVGFVLGLVFSDNIENIRKAIEYLLDTKLFPPEIYYLTEIPADLDWSQTLSIVVMSLGLSMAATLFPSLRAAGTDPVKVLRNE